MSHAVVERRRRAAPAGRGAFPLLTAKFIVACARCSGQPDRSRDVDHLGVRLQRALAVGAVVRAVVAAAARRRPRHSSTSSLGVGVHPRRVGQPGRHARPRPRASPVATRSFICVQLGGGRRAVVPADGEHPQRALRHQVGRVARRCPGRAGRGIRRPCARTSRSRPGRRSSRRSGGAARPATASSTGAYDSPSWPSTSVVTPWLILARWSGFGQQLQVGVRVHVDEPGCQHQAVGVDHPVVRVSDPGPAIVRDPAAR